jgi:hypothetical protein
VFIRKESDKHLNENVQEIRFYETYGRSKAFGFLRYKLVVKVFDTHNQAHDIRLNGAQKNRSSKLEQGYENHSCIIPANDDGQLPSTGEQVVIQLVPLNQQLADLMIRIADGASIYLTTGLPWLLCCSLSSKLARWGICVLS